MYNFFSKARNNFMLAKCRLHSALSNSRGEGFVDSAVKILIAIVIGALLLGGLYLLFNEIILPTLNERVQEMFDFNG